MVPDSLKDKTVNFLPFLGPPWYSFCLAFLSPLLYPVYHFNLQLYHQSPVIFFFNIPWCLWVTANLPISWLFRPLESHWTELRITEFTRSWTHCFFFNYILSSIIKLFIQLLVTEPVLGPRNSSSSPFSHCVNQENCSFYTPLDSKVGKYGPQVKSGLWPTFNTDILIPLLSLITLMLQ